MQQPPLLTTMAMGAGPQGGRPMYPSLIDGPPVTQPSSISVASGAQLRQQESDQRSGRRTAVAAIAGVLLGGCVLASAVMYRNVQNRAKLGAVPAETADPGLAATTATATATATTATTTTVPPATNEAPDAGPVAATDATATTGTTGAILTPPPVKPTATVKPPRPAPTVKPPPATTEKPQPAADCATPVWFDAQGVKHYKPQCLDK